MEQKTTDPKAVIGLVLGILAILCSFFSSIIIPGIIGIILGIVGLILGITSKKSNPSGLATAAIIVSAIGIGFSVVGTIACVACYGAIAANY